MHFRYARHTRKIEQLEQFYTEILGLKLLGRFINHDQYDGIFLGLESKDWHLEFTQNGDLVPQHWDKDDLLVFYPTNQEHYQYILNQIEQKQIQKHTPQNPYWQINGIQIKDPDGYAIIVSAQKL